MQCGHLLWRELCQSGHMNWRLTFRFVGADAELVDYQDYH